MALQRYFKNDILYQIVRFTTPAKGGNQMKVGIISINMYSKGLNFACPLHTYAFQQFLLKNGIESTVINYTPVYYDNFDLRTPYNYYARKCDILEKKREGVTDPAALAPIDAKLKEYTVKRDSWEPLTEKRQIRYDKMQRFIDTRYVKTDFCYNSDLLEVMDPGFDCYICATDVIWKNQPNVGYDRGYFLASSCMDNKWKIAYSASRGVYFADSREEDEQFFHYLEDIDYISVRESSLRDYIEQNTDRKAEVVLDPVLLHEKEFYDDISVTPPEEHYLLLYYVMEKASDTIRGAVRYARKHHMKIVEITDLPLENGRLEKYPDIEKVYRFDIGIEEWLGYIRNADCVFTNSFHACCFCILFEKEFYAGFRHGDKVLHLLETFGLADRRITLDPKPEQATAVQKVIRKIQNVLADSRTSQNASKIDYTEARKTLAMLREHSSDFILSALQDIGTRQRSPRDYDSYRRQLTYPVLYNSKKKFCDFTWTYETGTVKKLKSGSFEYYPENNRVVNNETSCFLKNEFSLKHYRFAGWNIRFRIDNLFFWYLNDGTFKQTGVYNKKTDPPVKVFREGETIPFIPVNKISIMIAEATWQEEPHDGHSEDILKSEVIK